MQTLTVFSQNYTWSIYLVYAWNPSIFCHLQYTYTWHNDATSMWLILHIHFTGEWVNVSSGTGSPR